MKITSPNSGRAFEWQDEIALALGEELTPFLAEMPVNERIAAMAYQIGAAAWEMGGPNDHQCLDAVKAELLGHLVCQFVTDGFNAQRKLEAELMGVVPSDDGNEACDA